MISGKFLVVAMIISWLLGMFGGYQLKNLVMEIRSIKE